MSRVINPESAGKQRNQLSKAIVLAVRELACQNEPAAEARDLAAFIAITLKAIANGIDISVSAWEKRDYWVKADKFRMEWEWAGSLSHGMEQAVLAEEWGTIAGLAAQIAQKLGKVQVSAKYSLGRPWEGSFEQLRKNRVNPP